MEKEEKSSISNIKFKVEEIESLVNLLDPNNEVFIQTKDLIGDIKNSDDILLQNDSSINILKR